MDNASQGDLPPSPRLRELFDGAVDLPDQDARNAYFLEAQATASERAGVIALIISDREIGTKFDLLDDLWASQLKIDPASAATIAGQYVGPYFLEEMLSQNASTVTFLATRRFGDAKQSALLKLLRVRLFSVEARHRFRRDRATLSQFMHPNIARLVGGGVSATCIPYVAMERVRGTDLITFAETMALDRTARLGLLRDLCTAVHAAHCSLIVHCNLNSAHVLVDSQGCLKVVDFGIAKLLDDAGSAGAHHISPGTGYAAPELYRGVALKTSSDVYALGILAGELLLGVRLGPDATWPDQGTSPLAITPDADLANLLRMALASAPEMRYPSASHFADDILRYLRDQPLTAHPALGWYRARKFFSRNRGNVLTVLLLVMFAALWALGIGY